MTSNRPILSVAVTVLGAVTLVGCGLMPRPEGIDVWNNVGEPVEVTYLKHGEAPGGRIDPGATATFVFDIKRPGALPKDECTTADIAVRTLDGHEIGRIPPPACVGSQFQVDRLPAPASPAP